MGEGGLDRLPDAKQLLADGTITQAEFEQLKAKALS
ncbi:SHOCT domain-containing protein [Nocardia otitidiscaviarum]